MADNRLRVWREALALEAAAKKSRFLKAADGNVCGLFYFPE
jgi:hypothetical protein